MKKLIAIMACAVALAGCNRSMFATIEHVVDKPSDPKRERREKSDEAFVAYEDLVRDRAKKAFSLHGLPKTIRCYVKVPEDDPAYRIGEHPYWFITITNDVSDKVKEAK